MKRFSKVLFCIGTCFTLAAIAYVLSGELDRLSNDGEANSEVALLAITFYWILGSFVCWALAVWPEKWKQLALLAFSTGLCTVLLEAGLAWLNPSLALREFEFLRSSRQHHVLLPEAAYDLGRFEGKHISVQTNSDRLRTEYSKRSFRKYENRVVCLGDSFTFGAWVDGEESYPAQLENKLRQLSHENVAVLNAGMLSYSPVLHRELLFNTLMQYEPTVVTLMLDCTDIGDDYHYLKDYDRFRENGPFAGEILSRPTPHFGALWRLAKPVHPILLAPIELLQRLNGNHVPHDPLDYYHFEIPVAGAIETDRFFIYRHPLTKTRPFFDNTYSVISEIAEMCKVNGVPFVLFIAPRYHHWSAMESPENWERSVYGETLEHQNAIFDFFDEMAKESEFEIINLLPAFQKTEEFPLVFRTDPHWNSAGNRFVAGQVASVLLKRELVTGIEAK